MNKKTKDFMTLLGIGGLLIQAVKTIIDDAKEQVIKDINNEIKKMEDM